MGDGYRQKIIANVFIKNFAFNKIYVKFAADEALALTISLNIQL